MTIDTSKLVFAAMLQDPLIGHTADLLIDGTVYFYSNTNRTTLKNVYYQSGTVAPYSYVALPNPMTLSASGTMVDGSGNDIIPGYYPFSEDDNTTSETYFIQVYNSAGTLVFTRYNFPIVATNAPPPPTGNGTDTKQLIKNNRFWRNIGTATLTNVTSQIVAPDQHDGFGSGMAGPSAPIPTSIMSDITFNKTNTGSVDTCTFTKFALASNQQLTGDVTPEYYLNHTCSASGGGETLKYYQFPVSLHLRTLNAQYAQVTIQGIDNNAANTPINLYWFQYQGYGQTSSIPTSFKTITLSSTWTKTTVTAAIPSDLGTTVDSGPGDDALYLWVGLPPNVTCNISFAVPCVYLLSNIDDVPTNSFSSYDEVNAITSSPRTGDIRSSVNSFYPYGWVPMNNGTIGSSSSNATAYAGTAAWPLFSLLWNMFKPYGPTVFPIYRSDGPLSTYSANILTDWNGNKAIALTRTMAQVLMGNVPTAALLPSTATLLGNTTTFTATSAIGSIQVNPANVMTVYQGMPIIFSSTGTLPTGLSTNTIYYAGTLTVNPSVFYVATTFSNALTYTYVAYTDAGTGTHTVSLAPNSAVGGEYSHTQQLEELAAHTHSITTESGAGGTNIAATASLGPTPVDTTSTGSSLAMNVVQSSTFMNLFIKL